MTSQRFPDLAPTVNSAADLVEIDRVTLERMDAVITQVRRLSLDLPTHMYTQPRFRPLFTAMNCLDGPLFSNEPDWCASPKKHWVHPDDFDDEH